AACTAQACRRRGAASPSVLLLESSPPDPLSVPERGDVLSSPSPEGRGGQGVRTQGGGQGVRTRPRRVPLHQTARSRAPARRSSGAPPTTGAPAPRAARLSRPRGSRAETARPPRHDAGTSPTAP